MNCKSYDYRPPVWSDKKETVETTKEKVLAAAKESCEAERIMKKLYPECFDNSVHVDSSFIKTYLDVRIDGEYCRKSIYLSPNFNWELKTDSQGVSCLIPIEK